VTGFHDAFVAARRRIEEGADPDDVVPALLEQAEAQEEIEMAEGLYDGELDEDEELRA
jgi:hypothetical protein